MKISIRLDFRPVHLKSCGHFSDWQHTRTNNPTRMWPVQTLTLLLCLTDEEQLYAQQVPQEAVPATIEVRAPEEEPIQNALELSIEAEA